MNDNRLPISCQADIKLKSIASIGQSLIERCKGIFRNRFRGARAAVAEQKWPG
jgi:hypothetical protein